MAIYPPRFCVTSVCGCESVPTIPCVRLSVVEGSDAGQDLALEQLKRGATAGGDEGDLLLHVELGCSGGGVAPADDALVARLGRLGDCSRSTRTRGMKVQLVVIFPKRRAMLVGLEMHP
eukprot:4655172-Pleurochrysis_carterae.AAC.3